MWAQLLRSAVIWEGQEKNQKEKYQQRSEAGIRLQLVLATHQYRRLGIGVWGSVMGDMIKAALSGDS